MGRGHDQHRGGGCITAGSPPSLLESPQAGVYGRISKRAPRNEHKAYHEKEKYRSTIIWLKTDHLSALAWFISKMVMVQE